MEYLGFNHVESNFFRPTTDLIEERGLKPIIKVIESLGGWPIVEGKNWLDHHFYWQKILQQLELRGFNTDQLFNLFIDVDMKNSSRKLFYVIFEFLLFFRTFSFFLCHLSNDIISTTLTSKNAD